MRFPRFIATIWLLFALAVATPALAQEHAPATQPGKAPSAQAADPAHPPAAEGEGAEDHQLRDSKAHVDLTSCLLEKPRELTEHAAQLAVQVAEERIRRSITPDDQIRLVDRYAAQLRDAR